MKPNLAARPRSVRLLALGAGALGLGAGATGALPSPGQAQSPTATMAVEKEDQRVRYRERVAVRVHAEARKHLQRGGVALVQGTVRPGDAGRRVYVQMRRGGRWRTADRARTRSGGRFKAAWRQREAGRFPVRVVFRGDRRNAAASDRASGQMNVYRPGHASWYGPGLYGNRTACGGTLGAGTLGVAHKSLPCGTRVTFRYRGRSVTVPVIDRGPFAAGREWDLTGATKRTLRFGSTGTVWAAH